MQNWFQWRPPIIHQAGRWRARWMNGWMDRRSKSEGGRWLLSIASSALQWLLSIPITKCIISILQGSKHLTLKGKMDRLMIPQVIPLPSSSSLVVSSLHRPTNGSYTGNMFSRILTMQMIETWVHVSKIQWMNFSNRALSAERMGKQVIWARYLIMVKRMWAKLIL